ncbi:MAG: ImmA/IrrE family metallo-endopeptidase [Tissierellia bacterium]|nr:ImmA/IrrE family metallo-endopeptidase [Bacillota bacterium]NLL23082.1 ImmA/IrrE family metallo-endopeptidase [Tissierellia bacterium]
MTRYEILLDDHDITEHDFLQLKGIYINGSIGIKKDLSNAEKLCIAYEEIGHKYFTVGDITDLYKPNNVRQELRARAWAYGQLLPLEILGQCNDIYDLIDSLGITEDFFRAAIADYRGKYGDTLYINGQKINLGGV